MQIAGLGSGIFQSVSFLRSAIFKVVVLNLSWFAALFQRLSTPVAPCLEYCLKETSED